MSLNQKLRDLFAQKINSIEQFYDIMNTALREANVSRRFAVRRLNDEGRPISIDGINVIHLDRNLPGYFNSRAYAPTGAGPYDSDTNNYLSRDRLADFTGDNSEGYASGYPFYAPGSRANEDPVMQHTWWWHREQMRMALRIYPSRPAIMSDVVGSFGLQAYCIHPSTDADAPYAVSYTPDAVAGKADKQVRVSSFGKLLRKLIPLMTDEHVGKLEAAYRAAVDPNFEIAWSESEIITVYTTMRGDSGCMRYEGESKWGLPDGMHPSMVYATGEIGVAFHRNAAGEIVSRSLIFTKPDGTKGYLRVYGDGALRTKLERAGYVLSDLSGMKVRAIPHPAYKPDQHRWLLPYIDGMGGDQSNHDGAMGMIDAADPKFVRLLTYEQASRLTSLYGGNSAPSIKSHSDVCVHIRPIAIRQWTCALSGVVFSSLDAAPTFFWNGTEIVPLCNAEAQKLVSLHNLETISFYDGTEFKSAIYLTDKAEIAKPPYFFYSHSKYLDDEATRIARGYRRLDPAAYPNESSLWALPDANHVEIVGDNGPVLIRKVDAGYLITDTDGITSAKLVYMPADVAKGLVATGQWVQTLVHRSTRALASHDHPKLITLRSGRRAIFDLHEVVRCYDGTWSTPRMVKTVGVFGVTLTLPLDVAANVADITLTDAQIDSRVKSRSADADPISDEDYAHWLLSDYFDVGRPFARLLVETKGVVMNRTAALLRQGAFGKYLYLLPHADNTETLHFSSGESFTNLDRETLPVVAERVRMALENGRYDSEETKVAATQFLRIYDHAARLVKAVTLPLLLRLRDYYGTISHRDAERLMAVHCPEALNEVAPEPAV